jgi:hypothetical protein
MVKPVHPFTRQLLLLTALLAKVTTTLPTMLFGFMQVASRTHVVLFDLMTLCQHHPEALESCLGPLLGDGAVLKLGFEVAGDIAKLAGSWPAVGCFRQVVGVLDLRPLFVAYALAAAKHPVSRGAGQSLQDGTHLCFSAERLFSLFVHRALTMSVCLILQGRSARTLSAVGLSTLCQELLGKALGKCCAALRCPALPADGQLLSIPWPRP